MDLSLVSMDEMLEEMDKRFDSVIVLTCSVRADGDVLDSHSKGSSAAQIGMAKIFINNRLNEHRYKDKDSFADEV